MISILDTGRIWSQPSRRSAGPLLVTDRPPDLRLDFWTKEVSQKKHIYFQARIMSFPEGSGKALKALKRSDPIRVA